MRVYRCDRCGRIGPRGMFTQMTEVSDYDPMDLCDKCKRSFDVWMADPLGEGAVMDIPPAPTGTFEWVLARIRLGEKPEKFRRCCWPSRHRLTVRSGDMLRIESEPDSPWRDMQVDSFDILATDWEESE